MKSLLRVPVIIFLVVIIAVGLILLAGKSNLSPVSPNPTPTSTQTTTNSQSPSPVTQLQTKYILAQDWPPKVTTETKSYGCTRPGSASAPSGQTKEVKINGHTYCVTTESEGAAGSIYNKYAFTRAQGSGTQVFTFSLKFVQCGNYPQPQNSECQNERNNFNINSFIDSYISSNF